MAFDFDSQQIGCADLSQVRAWGLFLDNLVVPQEGGWA